VLPSGIIKKLKQAFAKHIKCAVTAEFWGSGLSFVETGTVVDSRDLNYVTCFSACLWPVQSEYGRI